MRKQILKTFFLLSVFLMLPNFAKAEYGVSNYLTYPADANNYPASVVAGWGSVQPPIGVVIDAPTAFGGGVKRRADHSELSGAYGTCPQQSSTIVYSRYTPENTTNELVLIHDTCSSNAWVMRTSDNVISPVPLKQKPSEGSATNSLGEVNELRWDYTGQHPYRLYFVGYKRANSHNSIGGENVATSFYYTDIDPATLVQSVPVLIHDFSDEFPAAGSYPTGGYVGNYIINDVEGDSSNDSRYWAWMVMDPNTGGTYLPRAIITYDMQTDTILGRIQRDCTGVAAPCTVFSTPSAAIPYMSRPNMVEISPSGSKVHLNYGRVYNGNRIADYRTLADHPHMCDKDFSDCFIVGSGEGHSGWGWMPNGHEAWVYQNDRVVDYIAAVDVTDSATTNCVFQNVSNGGDQYTCGINISMLYSGGWDPSYNVGVHFGKIYDPNLKGWVLVDTSDDAQTRWAGNQALMVEIKAYDENPAPRVWRMSPIFNTHWDYRSEGSGALNFDATEFWTTANWGTHDIDSISGYTINNEVYSVGLPGNWHDVLGDDALPPSAPGGLVVM